QVGRKTTQASMWWSGGRSATNGKRLPTSSTAMGRQLQANLSSPTVAAQRAWADCSPVLQFRRQRNVCFGSNAVMTGMGEKRTLYHDGSFECCGRSSLIWAQFAFEPTKMCIEGLIV